MSETLHLVLLVLATLSVMTWFFYWMFKTKRKIKSRRFSEKREGVQELKAQEMKTVTGYCRSGYQIS